MHEGFGAAKQSAGTVNAGALPVSDELAASTDRRLHVMTLAVTMTGAYLLLIAWCWSYTMDDAFISFRYAKHIGDGLGPIWNLTDKAHPVEGFTSFLHVWLLGFLRYITGLEVFVFGKVLGVIAVIVLAWSIARESNKRRFGFWPAFVALSFLLLPFTALNAVSGMETSLFMLLNWLCAITCIRLLDAPTGRQTWIFVVYGLAGTLTRPEFAVAFGLMAAFAWWRRPEIRKTLLKAIVFAYVLPGLALTGWRYYYYGDLVPNPFYVKQARRPNKWGSIQVVRFLGLCALPYLILAASSGRRLWTSYRNVLVVVVLNLGFVCAYFSTTLPLMNYWFRFLIPQLPLIAFCAAVALKADEGLVRSRLFPLRFAAGALLLVISLAHIPTIGYFQAMHEESESRYREIGERLRPFAAPDRWLAYYDVGRIVYESEWNTVDVVGLNTRRSNLKSACLMRTDIVLRFWRANGNVSNPCPEIYYSLTSLPFYTSESSVDSSMQVYVRNDITYARELQAHLLDGWPEPTKRSKNLQARYWNTFKAYLGPE